MQAEDFQIPRQSNSDSAFITTSPSMKASRDHAAHNISRSASPRLDQIFGEPNKRQRRDSWTQVSDQATGLGVSASDPGIDRKKQATVSNR